MSTLERFSKANDLWFEKGYTRRALQLYRSLVKESPNDPVFLYQLSRALWALDDFEEAFRSAERAHANRDHLNDKGRRVLDRWRTQMAAGRPSRLPPGLTPDLLDVETLERTHAPLVRWVEVGSAAEERELYGVAAEALGQSLRGADHDTMRDIQHAFISSRVDRHLLEDMVTPSLTSDREPGQPGPAKDGALPAIRRRRVPQVDHAARPTQPAPSDPEPSPIATRKRPRNRRGSTLQAVPLTLSVSVIPPTSPIGARVELLVRLTNSTSTSMLVNQRLLLQPHGAPDELGELTLDVRGPPGYQNLREVHVRSGSPGPGDFTVLAPGEVVERSVRLWRYESLHLPGRYRLIVTYRNTTQFEVDGHAALIGIVTGEGFAERTGQSLLQRP